MRSLKHLFYHIKLDISSFYYTSIDQLSDSMIVVQYLRHAYRPYFLINLFLNVEFKNSISTPSVTISLPLFQFIYNISLSLSPLSWYFLLNQERCGRVVKLLACGARGPGFDSPPRHLNFRDWLSPASKSRYG